ncbi:hypothetical protein C8J56DRAFT_1031650 [Mycena floridula]|nr:hypothetical protein C8J56DRAFT_1031650 [Mycena floridula]
MRRGNKSHKVPNVKLRPGDPVQPLRRINPDDDDPSSDDLLVQDSQAYDTSTIVCPRPFAGLYICASGIDKSLIFPKAEQLGAACISAFTDRVTHLVASEHGSAKYKCALERKIPILQPSWVTSSYDIWLRGDDVDVAESLEKYRLPIFQGVNVCPSGIDDTQRRTQIHKLIVKEEGAYSRDLVRPVVVTHLLCSGDQITDKMRYAEKFNQRKEAKIHIVWEEWFWDCLDFGGRFDEAAYLIQEPRPERKSLTMPPISPPTSTAALIPSKNIYQKPSDVDEEIASINRPPAVALKFWDSLLKPRGIEITSKGTMLKSPSKANSEVRPLPVRPPSPIERQPLAKTTSVLHASEFRRANSFVSHSSSQVKRPFQRAPSKLDGPMASPGAGPSQIPDVVTSERSIFSGLRFRLLGEAKQEHVRSAIQGGGGMVVTGDQKTVDFIIVRLVTGSKLYREEYDEDEKSKYRTECWLEQCIHEDRLCEADEHVAYLPLGIDIPIIGAEEIRLSFSGLDDSEQCFLRRLFKALGITLPPTFSKHSTHLLCPSRTGLKFNKAAEWGVPVVDMQWLKDIATTGQIPHHAELVSKVDKGKAKAEEAMAISRSRSPPIRDTEMFSDKPNDDGPPTTPSTPGHNDSPRRSNVSLQAMSSLEYITRPNSQLKPRSPTPDLVELQRGRKRDKDLVIPSSNSPSPLKGSASSTSPLKGPSKDMAKALQDGITNLLVLGKGKRPSEDDMEGNRGGKRARPQRPKLQPHSRQPSIKHPPPKPQFEYDLSTDLLGVEQESMQLRYEDPDEELQRQKLLKLAGVPSAGGSKVKEKTRRKSQRLSGS